MSDEQDPSFGALLEFLKRSRGFDFSGYKRASLARRFRRRMETIGIAGFGDYVDYLEVHPDEYEQLFNTLLINVTEFFRDPPAWEHLRTAEALPEILEAKRDGDPIRIWSAGCASGHEAYTVAMILAELLGVDAFRERVKIYATDVDEEALEAARHAIYTPKEIEQRPGGPARPVLRAPTPAGRVPQGPPPERDLRPPRPDRRTRRSRGSTC